MPYARSSQQAAIRHTTPRLRDLRLAWNCIWHVWWTAGLWEDGLSGEKALELRSPRRACCNLYDIIHRRAPRSGEGRRGGSSSTRMNLKTMEDQRLSVVGMLSVARAIENGVARSSHRLPPCVKYVSTHRTIGTASTLNRSLKAPLYNDRSCQDVRA